MLEKLTVTTRTRMRYSQSRERLAAPPLKTHDDGSGGCHAGQENVRAVHSPVLGRRAVRSRRASDGRSLRRFPGLQPDGSSEATAHFPGLDSLATPALPMLGCWAAICWRLLERSHVQMALFALLGLSAY